MRVIKKNETLIHYDGPTGAPTVQSSTDEAPNVVSDREVTSMRMQMIYPNHHRFFQYSILQRHLRDPVTFHLNQNSLPSESIISNNNDSSINTNVPEATSTIATTSKSAIDREQTPEDAMALLSFSRQAKLGSAGKDPDATTFDSNLCAQNNVYMDESIEATNSVDTTNDGMTQNTLVVDGINNPVSINGSKDTSVEFRYPIDFAVGMILRKKILLPILNKDACDEDTAEKWKDVLDGASNEIALKLGKFMRGEQVLISSVRETTYGGNLVSNEKKKRKRLAAELDENNSQNSQKKAKQDDTDLQSLSNSNNVDMESQSAEDGIKEGLESGPEYTLDATLPFSATIQRCTAEDAKILASWYYDLGDKYLPDTSPSWSTWWENKCRFPDPACEMLKLVLPLSSPSSSSNSSQDNKEIIIGVAYYERNVLDYMLNDRRTTLIRGIRTNPRHNPAVIQRSQLRSSNNEASNLYSYDTPNEISTLLFTAVLFNSLLCGTSCLGVSAMKNEQIEKFYQSLMGEAIAFRNDDGRKYFVMEGEDRFLFLRKEFEKQWNMYTSLVGEGQDQVCHRNNSGDNEDIPRRISLVPENPKKKSSQEKKDNDVKMKTVEDQPNEDANI